MSSIPEPAEQVYRDAKRAAEVRYAQDLAAIVHLRGGNEVREAARRRAHERLTEAYEDARLIGLYHGNPVVDAAEQALRSEYGDLPREQAALLLVTWAHAAELSERERAGVLARFGRESAGGAR